MKNKVCIIILLSMLLFSCEEPVSEPVNFLIILTDDQTPGTLGCYDPGSPINTPEIDQLAKEGVRFTNGFVTTPICAVSRASILTGKYVTNHRMHQFVTPMEADIFEGIYPQYLKKQGYFTGQLGKYGVGITEEQQALYDVFVGQADQGPAFREYKGRIMHDTEWLTVLTEEFLDQVPKDQPFCLQLNYKEPHPSSKPDIQDDTVLDDTQFPRVKTDTNEDEELLPDFVRASYGVGAFGIGGGYHGNDLIEDEPMNIYKRQYFERVISVDRSVGELRKMLKKRGLDKNTVIIFLSDHGTHLGEKHQIAKWTPYEQSLRIPFIYYDPRNSEASGTTNDEMVLNIDVAPTILDLAGLEVPNDMDGESLVSLVNGTTTNFREFFFFEHYYSPSFIPNYIPRNVGVRFKNAKYLKWIEVEADLDYSIEEYYDLSANPWETVNLIDSSSYKECVENARTIFYEWRKPNPSRFKYDEYGPQAQFGSQNINWDSIKVIRPEKYEKVKAEIERLGIDWETAMTDWRYRHEISKNTQYWY